MYKIISTYKWNEDNKTLIYTDAPYVIEEQTEHSTDAVHFYIYGNVNVISNSAFNNYYQLIYLILPDSVKKIGNSIIRNTKILSFHIPLSCNILNENGPFDWTYFLEEFTIDPDHQYFCVIDGVLYSKDMTTLMCFPCAKIISVFTIPYGVTKIYSSATSCIHYVQNFIIPQTLLQSQNIFYNCTNYNIKITVFRFEDQDDSTFQNTSTAFYNMPNYSRDNITFVHCNHYTEYFESNSSFIIKKYQRSSRLEYSDEYFANITNIKHVEVGRGISKINKNCFNLSKNVDFVFEDRYYTIRQCLCSTISYTYFSVFIFMYIN